MRRFAVFSGANYYPSGGMDDFDRSFDTREEAETYAETQKRAGGWVEVEDMEEYDK